MRAGWREIRSERLRAEMKADLRELSLVTMRVDCLASSLDQTKDDQRALSLGKKRAGNLVLNWAEAKDWTMAARLAK